MDFKEKKKDVKKGWRKRESLKYELRKLCEKSSEVEVGNIFLKIS